MLIYDQCSVNSSLLHRLLAITPRSLHTLYALVI